MDRDETNNREQIHAEAIAWLREMELVNDPSMLNSIVMNVYRIPSIKKAEFLADMNNRKMLILLELNFWGGFFKKRTTRDVLEMMQEFLPKYEFRVTFDRELFETACRRAKESLSGTRELR